MGTFWRDSLDDYDDGTPVSTIRARTEADDRAREIVRNLAEDDPWEREVRNQDDEFVTFRWGDLLNNVADLYMDRGAVDRDEVRAILTEVATDQKAHSFEDVVRHRARSDSLSKIKARALLAACLFHTSPTEYKDELDAAISAYKEVLREVAE